MDKINSFRGDYYFLSNYYHVDFEFRGLTYHSSEAAFQAQKCATEEGKMKYTQMTNPTRAKMAGKRETLPEGWLEQGPALMKEILRAKFSDPELAEMLLATGGAYLEEGNKWHDNRWGKCVCPACQDKEAHNYLGKALMEVRDELAQARWGEL